MSTPRALVTGASRGIGSEMAILLAQQGYPLVLVGREAATLNAIVDSLQPAGSPHEVLVADLSTASGLAAAAGRVRAGDITLVVSNAGIPAYGPFAALEPSALDAAWRLNTSATLVLTHAALPAMQAAHSGGLIIMSSALAFAGSLSNLPLSGRVQPPLPHRALYAASKAALLAFVRALSYDLGADGVRMTVTCPGIVATDWNGGVGLKAPTAMAPRDVALATWRAYQLGDLICVPGLENQEVLENFKNEETFLFRAAQSSAVGSRYLEARTRTVN